VQVRPGDAAGRADGAERCPGRDGIALGLLLLVAGVFVGMIGIVAGQIVLVVSAVKGLLFERPRRMALDFRGWRPSAWWLLLFVVFALVSIVANAGDIADPLGHAKKLRYFLIALLLVALPAVAQVLRDEKLRHRAVIVWLVTLVLAACVGLGEVLYENLWTTEKVRGKERRLAGLYDQAMTFGYVLQFSIVALAILFLSPGLHARLTRLPRAWLLPVLVLAGVAMSN